MYQNKYFLKHIIFILQKTYNFFIFPILITIIENLLSVSCIDVYIQKHRRIFFLYIYVWSLSTELSSRRKILKKNHGSCFLINIFLVRKILHHYHCYIALAILPSIDLQITFPSKVHFPSTIEPSLDDICP